MKDAIRYYQSLLYILDNVDRIELLQELETFVHRKDKIHGILVLNMDFVNYNNKTINVCTKNYDFRLALAYIACNIFIYNNSVKMINETDPYKYPKKNTNTIMQQDNQCYEENIESKMEYQGMLSCFNKNYNITLNYHKRLWQAMNEKQNKKFVDKTLFSACKDC